MRVLGDLKCHLVPPLAWQSGHVSKIDQHAGQARDIFAFTHRPGVLQR